MTMPWETAPLAMTVAVRTVQWSSRNDGIPECLRRDKNNQAPFMRVSPAADSTWVPPWGKINPAAVPQ